MTAVHLEYPPKGLDHWVVIVKESTTISHGARNRW